MVRKATPRLLRLIADVLRYTQERGAKVALAARLGVLPQHLNKWLRGSEPGGEITLQLVEWVAEAKASTKQKKRAGSADTRPALKTRNRKSTSHEKSESRLREQ